MTGLYERLRDAGCKIENYRSDLYTPVTEVSTRIIRTYVKDSGWKWPHPLATTFRDPNDGSMWWDCALQFEPYWKRITA